MDPTLPVKDVTGELSGATVGYFQSLDLFGRYVELLRNILDLFTEYEIQRGKNFFPLLF